MPLDDSLRRLPCGCVFDVDSQAKAILDDDGTWYFECPWCAASFAAHDLFAWHQGDPTPVTVGQGPRHLMLFGMSAVELIGHCNCGATLVRHRSGISLHLRLPANALVLLEN